MMRCLIHVEFSFVKGNKIVWTCFHSFTCSHPIWTVPSFENVFFQVCISVFFFFITCCIFALPPSLHSQRSSPHTLPLHPWEATDLHPRAFHFSGTSSVYRISHLISYWGQAKQSSPIYVSVATEQPKYAFWLLA